MPLRETFFTLTLEMLLSNIAYHLPGCSQIGYPRAAVIPFCGNPQGFPICGYPLVIKPFDVLVALFPEMIMEVVPSVIERLCCAVRLTPQTRLNSPRWPILSFEELLRFTPFGPVRYSQVAEATGPSGQRPRNQARQRESVAPSRRTRPTKTRSPLDLLPPEHFW